MRNCCKMYWSQENPIIDIPRLNIIAEKEIESMEEIRETLKLINI